MSFIFIKVSLFSTSSRPYNFWNDSMKTMQTLVYKELFPGTTTNIFDHVGITPWVKLERYQHICVEKDHSFADV